MKFGKQFIAFLLLVGIFINCFNYWILSSSYTFNKKYISTVLCSNRSHPELHCEGKCFMDIKLKELAQKNKGDQENLKRVIETIAPTSTGLLTRVFEINIKKIAPIYLDKNTINVSIAIFHPPKLV